MKSSFEVLLNQFLSSFSNALAVSFNSVEISISIEGGSDVEILRAYKDIPMLSIDENFTTSFSFIIIESGSIIVFFIDGVHFISVYTQDKEPNKELAERMYSKFYEKFKNEIANL
ncbi:MAG: hypothetical protein GDA42_09455 [Ekhidna sp.]|nr:hypothetical protein [Ekhidna sp.]